MAIFTLKWCHHLNFYECWKQKNKNRKLRHDIRTWFCLHLWHSNYLIISLISWYTVWFAEATLGFSEKQSFCFLKKSNITGFWVYTCKVGFEVGKHSILEPSPRESIRYGGWSEFGLVQERGTLLKNSKLFIILKMKVLSRQLENRNIFFKCIIPLRDNHYNNFCLCS